MPGLVGLMTHYPAYRLAGFLAFRYAGSELDIAATAKVLAGLLLFPLTWLLDALLVAVLFSPWAGAVTLVVLPVAGVAALFLAELSSAAGRRLRTLVVAWREPGFVQRTLEERRVIRGEILRIGQRLERSSEQHAR